MTGTEWQQPHPDSSRRTMFPVSDEQIGMFHIGVMYPSREIESYG